jgi:hypothetical protein
MTEAARPHISNGEFQEFEELLAEYEDIFAVDSRDHGRSNRVYHRIDTGYTRPIREPLAIQAEVTRCSTTCDAAGLSRNQTAPGHPPLFWSGKRMGKSVSAWTTGN